MIAARILRWLCDPAKLEAIEGDLLELYGGRASWRALADVASVCVRQPRTALRSAAAALVLLALTGRAGPPPHYTIHATDPAGAFTLEVHRQRVIAATLNGAAVPLGDVRQSGNSLVIRGANHGADFYIAIKPEGGISWYPRQSSSR